MRLEPNSLVIGAMMYGWEVSARQALDILNNSYDFGVRTIDTSPSYGEGLSESIIGYLLSKNLNLKFKLITKFSISDQKSTNLIEAHILNQYEGSIKRLRAGFIDEYVLHNNVSPKQVGCISDSILKLKSNNLIGKFFVSNVGLNIFKEFLLYEKKIGVKIIDGVQLNKSLLYEDRLYKEVSAYKAIERYAFSPLAQGFLTGKYSLERGTPKDTRISNATKNLEFYNEILSLKNFKKLEEFSCRAEKNKISLTTYAYQFLYKQKNVDKVIIGVRNLTQLDEAMLTLSYLKENKRNNL